MINRVIVGRSHVYNLHPLGDQKHASEHVNNIGYFDVIIVHSSLFLHPWNIILLEIYTTMRKVSLLICIIYLFILISGVSNKNAVVGSDAIEDLLSEGSVLASF